MLFLKKYLKKSNIEIYLQQQKEELIKPCHAEYIYLSHDVAS